MIATCGYTSSVYLTQFPSRSPVTIGHRSPWVIHRRQTPDRLVEGGPSVTAEVGMVWGLWGWWWCNIHSIASWQDMARPTGTRSSQNVGSLRWRLAPALLILMQLATSSSDFWMTGWVHVAEFGWTWVVLHVQDPGISGNTQNRSKYIREPAKAFNNGLMVWNAVPPKGYCWILRMTQTCDL